jgi:hypothetical protein
VRCGRQYYTVKCQLLLSVPADTSRIYSNYGLLCWYWMTSPVLVAVRSKTLVCSYSIAGVAG